MERLFLVKFSYGSTAWDIFCAWNSDESNAPDPLVACIVLPPPHFLGMVLAPAVALYGAIAVSLPTFHSV